MNNRLFGEKHYRVVYANMVRHYLSGMGGAEVLSYMTDEQAGGLLELGRLAALSTGLAYIPVHAPGHTAQARGYANRAITDDGLLQELAQYLNLQPGDAIPEGCEFPRYWTYAEGERVSAMLRKMEQARKDFQPRPPEDPPEEQKEWPQGVDAVEDALGLGDPNRGRTFSAELGDAPNTAAVNAARQQAAMDRLGASQPVTTPPVQPMEAEGDPEPLPRIRRAPQDAIDGGRAEGRF